MTIAIDIGGTSTKFGLVQENRIIRRTRIPTNTGQSFEDYLDKIVIAITELCDGQQIEKVGIGAPNGNQLTGCIDNAPNLPWNGELPMVKLLSSRLRGVSCSLANDANAAALGIWKYEFNQTRKDIIAITVGTGLGSGIIINDRILLGPRGNAGELGHTNIVIDGRKCSCGLNGCLESYVSIRGIRQTFNDLGDCGDIQEQEGVEPIAELALRGDAAALNTFRHTGRWLAAGLANSIALFAPEQIVLCGGIARSGDLLLHPTLEYMEQYTMPMHRGKTIVSISSLPDEDAALLGASAIA